MSTTAMKEAAQILIGARLQVNELLAEAENSFVLLSTNAGLDKVVNRLQHLGGYDFNAESPVDFPPVTNFMGEELKPTPLVFDLDPNEADRAIYLEKVEKLFNEIPIWEAAEVIHANTLPEDILVLRGVAKKAGIEDYDTAEITVEFIEDIQDAIETILADQVAQADIDKALGANAETAGAGETQKQLTEEEIDAALMKAQPKADPGPKKKGK